MREYLPILIVGAIIGVFTLLFLVAFLILKCRKEDMTDRDRHMSDKEIVGRLLRYAKPYWKSFIVVFIIMLFSIGYELVLHCLIFIRLSPFMQAFWSFRLSAPTSRP